MFSETYVSPHHHKTIQYDKLKRETVKARTRKGAAKQNSPAPASEICRCAPNKMPNAGRPWGAHP
jgi:hypothetical protein